jgi:hypothetical protein
MDLHIQINGIIAVFNQDAVVLGPSKKDVESQYLLVELMNGNLVPFIPPDYVQHIKDHCIKLIGGLKELLPQFLVNGVLSNHVEGYLF